MATIMAILENTRPQHRVDYQTLIKSFWANDQEGVTPIKIADLQTWTSETLKNKKEYGMEIEYLKVFPIACILNEMEDLEEAATFCKRVFYSTASQETPVKKDQIMELLKIKLNTLKLMEDSNSIAKGKINFDCGPLDDTYKKLANRTEDVDIMAFFEGFTQDDKAEIGIELARNGLKYKKENNGKWITLRTTGGKKVEIYFASSDDEKGNNYLTHGRCAIATARETSMILVEKDNCTALGLNIGWKGILNVSALSDINAFFSQINIPPITLESMMMAAIPKVKPNPCLNMNVSEAYIMICFHIINDSFNSSKRKDSKYEANFTSDIFSKLNNMNINVQGNIIMKIMEIILPKCFREMKHKGAIGREMVSIIKTITKTLVSWKGLQDKNDLIAELRQENADDKDMNDLITQGSSKK
jgi:hypothetical protein